MRVLNCQVDMLTIERAIGKLDAVPLRPTGRRAVVATAAQQKAGHRRKYGGRDSGGKCAAVQVNEQFAARKWQR